MLALCLMLSMTHYAQIYTGIMGRFLSIGMHLLVNTSGINITTFSLSAFFIYTGEHVMAMQTGDKHVISTTTK